MNRLFGFLHCGDADDSHPLVSMLFVRRAVLFTDPGTGTELTARA